MFFESAIYKNGKVQIGLIPRERLYSLKRGLANNALIPLRTLIRTPQRQFSGYHYAHGATYYKDGRICEAPKQLADSEQAGEVAAQASQSRWNFKDYHWEEQYNLILLRWCIDYLDEDELKAFLRQARAHLQANHHLYNAEAGP